MRYEKIMALPLSRSGYGRNAQQVWLFRTIHAEPSNASIMMITNLVFSDLSRPSP